MWTRSVTGELQVVKCSNLSVQKVCIVSYKKLAYLTVERKLVEFHEFKERSTDEACLANCSEACTVMFDAPVRRRLELANCVLNVQFRVPVVLQLIVVASKLLDCSNSINGCGNIMTMNS